MLEEIKKELEQLAHEGQKRALRDLEEVREGRIRIRGRWLVNLASNDYLGLASRWKLDKIAARFPGLVLGAGASRLLSGNHPLYPLLESCLEEAYQRPALVFSCGYMANLGVVTSLCGKKDVIFADKLVHASLIDALKLSGAKFFRYPHLDLNALEALLTKYRPNYRRALIISESVFSMDGDIPDLAGLIELKKRYEALLFLDEAHAVGVFGNKGLGVAEEQGLVPQVDFLLGTFGKALGAYGAFLITHPEFKAYLINKARPFIFTTALPPVVVAGAYLAFETAQKMTLERRALRKTALNFRKELGIRISETASQTPIIPVLVGENHKALALSEELFKAGYFAPAIRPPTVPPGTARLRLSLSAAIPWAALEKAASVINTFLTSAR